LQQAASDMLAASLLGTITEDGEFDLDMPIPHLRPLVPVWVAQAIRSIEARPELFNQAWGSVFASSFHDTLTAARAALAKEMLFRKGKGARCPDEPADEDSGDGPVETEEPEEDVDVGLLCLEAEEDEDDLPEDAEEPPASGPAGSGAAASTAPPPRPRLSQIERLAAIRLVYGRRPPRGTEARESSGASSVAAGDGGGPSPPPTAAGSVPAPAESHS
jgi:hypothetical protein